VAPPEYAHPTSIFDGVAVQDPEAANLTRNVIVRSSAGAATRGHVIFLGAASIDVRYAAFRDLGRTTLGELDNRPDLTDPAANHIGRYPMHLHMLTAPEHLIEVDGQSYRGVLIGNVIEGTAAGERDH